MMPSSTPVFLRMPPNCVHYQYLISFIYYFFTFGWQADYFKENYNPLRFPNLPCIMTDPKKCLIPWELCEIITGQRKQGALGSNQQV